MDEAVTAILCRLVLPLVALGVVSPFAEAHVLDEYLQATLVSINPGEIRLNINLTPGVEIADQVIRQIDRDGSGSISADEATAYAERLKRDLTARLDGSDAQLQLVAVNAPELPALRTGHGIIQVEFLCLGGSFGRGSHTLELENSHFPKLGAYLINAARPQSQSIQIISQKRNPNQSSGAIDFAYTPPTTASRRAAMAVTLMALLVLAGALVWRMRVSIASAMRAVDTPP
jgi:hypothetical protein